MNNFLFFLTILFLSTTSTIAQKLDVEGKIKLADEPMTAPQEGEIRWTGSDFQGYLNNEWCSLTQKMDMRRDCDDPNLVYINDILFMSTGEGPISSLLYNKECDCYNGIDDDGDGDIDCNDVVDCNGCVCNECDCADGMDNDGDGDIDCADSDCQTAPTIEDTYCKCSDGLDNDGDGLIDCDDPDCCSIVNCSLNMCSSTVGLPLPELYIDGSHLLAGHPNFDGDGGAIYSHFYNGSYWEKTGLIIRASDSGLRFGYAIELDGEFAIIGTASYRAYVLQRSGQVWTEVDQLFPSVYDGDYQEFGREVSISGDYAAITSITSDTSSVFVFHYDGSSWTESDRLRPSLSGNEAWDQFGYDVEIDEDYMIIGANLMDNNDQSIANGGAAFIFKEVNGVWTEDARLLPSEQMVEGNFGWYVTISGDYAAVTGFVPTGASTFIFHKTSTGWQEEFVIDDISGKISMQDDRLLIASNGEIFIYKRSGQSWYRIGERAIFSGGFPIHLQSSISGNYVSIGSSVYSIADIGIISTECNCYDGKDNDLNGLVDCDDPACYSGESSCYCDPNCEAFCNDGLDNDGDGDVDDNDSDCNGN